MARCPCAQSGLKPKLLDGNGKQSYLQMHTGLAANTPKHSTRVGEKKGEVVLEHLGISVGRMFDSFFIGTSVMDVE